MNLAMEKLTRTVVTFKSSSFNVSERKKYFINKDCFGDDLARWLAGQLRGKGYQASDEPSQEDFGWYFSFVVDDIEYCYVLGYRPEDDGIEGTWVGWIERSHGWMMSLLRGRNRGLQPEAIWTVHKILSEAPQIREIRWHTRSDFNRGYEEMGTLTPCSET